MERLIENQSEAVMMNKIFLQKIVKDTFMRNVNPKMGVEPDELNQFEDLAKSYFNVNAFSITTFKMAEYLSISDDYFLTLINKIMSYNKNNNIFQLTKIHTDYEQYGWIISYRTFDFLKDNGFVKVFEIEKKTIESQKITEQLNSNKLKWESKLVKWQAIAFWPLLLISIAGFIMSIIALSKK